jgi:hypothetical protein
VAEVEEVTEVALTVAETAGVEAVPPVTKVRYLAPALLDKVLLEVRVQVAALMVEAAEAA